MAIIIFLSFSLLLGLTASQQHGCRQVDVQFITGCLQPMIDLSQSLAVRNPRINHLTFPLFYFGHRDVLAVCETWLDISRHCLTADTLRLCPTHGLYRILEPLFGYSCSESTGKLFFEHHECLSNVIRVMDSCTRFIQAPTNPQQVPDRCGRMPHYYACVSHAVERQCGVRSLDVLGQAIMYYGCDLSQSASLKQQFENQHLPQQVHVQSTPQQTTHTAANVHTTQSRTSAASTAAQPQPTEAVVAPSVKTSTKVSTNATSETVTFTTSKDMPEPTEPVVSSTSSPSQESVQSELEMTKDSSKADADIRRRQPSQTKRTTKQKQTSATTARATSGSTTKSVMSTASTPGSTKNSPAEQSAESPEVSIEQPGTVVRVLDEESGEIDNTLIVEEDECTDDLKKQAHSCLKPLMNLWWNHTVETPELKGLVMGILAMRREQVLNLCDLYASSFLDCDLDTFYKCREDDTVKFADTQFGYACGNAPAFFRKFDCLSVLTRDSPKCKEHLMVDPTKTQDDQCNDLSKFHDCLKEQVELLCARNTMDILQEAITYFGCTDFGRRS